MSTEYLPPCKFAHDGKVRIMKVVDKDGKGYGGFQWPKSGEVIPATWSDKADCESGGLFGWAWWLAFGDGKDPQFINAIWIVFECEIEDTVHLSGKCKARRGNVIHYGSYEQALHLTIRGQIAYIQAQARGAASATWESGAASATGASGAASATGWRGAASATGWRGIASATGWRGIASGTNDYCMVECGPTGLACVTVKECHWKVHPGAIFVQRVGDNCHVLRAEEKHYGKIVTVVDGVIQ